jgi:hypothetical protein
MWLGNKDVVELLEANGAKELDDLDAELYS